MTSRINIGDGFVRLVDSMPRENVDEAIVQAARVSYADGTTTARNNEGLIRYLLRHWHTTPFEMAVFKFHIKMPIFIARQHMRHRTASVNEMSARYSVVPCEHFEPDEYRGQSSVNKQSSEGVLRLDPELVSQVAANKGGAFEIYQKMLDGGCSRELARCHLPQSTYTEFYWQMNLHNLMHYLHLRMEAGAQKEIRDYATAIYELVLPLAPLTMTAFKDFRLDAIHLSGPEVRAIHDNTNLSSKGEHRELDNKKKLLGIQ
jgi:thymidylate synthase (FAD)